MMNNKVLLDQIGQKYDRAIVTGGAGFIGSHICEELVKRQLFLHQKYDFIFDVINSKLSPGKNFCHNRVQTFSDFRTYQ